MMYFEFWRTSNQLEMMQLKIVTKKTVHVSFPTTAWGGVDIPRRHPLDPYITPKLAPPPLFLLGALYWIGEMKEKGNTYT